jgi:hypothetical protein
MSLNKKLSKNTNVKAKIVVESDNESIKEDIIKKDDKKKIIDDTESVKIVCLADKNKAMKTKNLLSKRNWKININFI